MNTGLMFFCKIAVICLTVALGCSLASCGKSEKNKKGNANEATQRNS